MSDIPIEVADSEKIVRAIMSPYHIKKGKLKIAAFRSAPGTDDVSVIRHSYKSSNFCKQRAKEIASNAEGKTYKGLAVLTALNIRGVGADVFDSRQHFCGHAHISYGIKTPSPNEPLESAANQRLSEMVRNLLKFVTYHEDLNPMGSEWTGPAL
jgi:hypothetical protein